MRLMIVLSFFISSASCQQMKINDSSRSVSCIQTLIDSNKNKPDWPVGSIDEYEYEGKLIYAFNPPSHYADYFTLIKSSDCKDLCNVGGFAGARNTSCNGIVALDKAVLKRRVWPISKQPNQ